MKIYNRSGISGLLIAVFILFLFTGSGAQTNKYDFRRHQAEIIDFGRNYPVSNLEPDLPQMSFAAWIQKNAGSKSKVNWAIIDCDLPNPVFETEVSSDLPMCVDASVQIRRKIFLHAGIEYGTFERGRGEKKPVVRFVCLSDEFGNCFSSVEKLHDLAKLLYSLKKKLVSFDPNNGEFEISGKKPAGFKDFSTIWFQTVDYDSNNKPFPVKKYGDIEAGGKHFDLRRIFFDGKRWSFETTVVGGVKYKFDGKFTKLKLDLYGSVDGAKVLRGHLIKFLKGKKAAEADLVFNFYNLGDFG